MAAAMLAAGVLVAVAPTSPARATPPPGCDRAWIAGNGAWTDGNNWDPVAVPLPTEDICIYKTTPAFVTLDASSSVDGANMTGSQTALNVHGGALFINGVDGSTWGPGTNAAVNTGQLGGTGTLTVQGALFFADPLSSGTSLSSVPGTGGQPPATPGALVVQGRAEVVAASLGLSSGYRVNVASGGSFVLDAGTFVTADRGTAVNVQTGGILQLQGDGGYYQGAAVSGQPAGSLTNNGLITKTGGSGTSVIDAAYGGSGRIEVHTGALAMPDAGAVSASVWPGSTFETGRCDPGVPTAACQPTANPAVDTMNVSLTVPAGGSTPDGVQLQELGGVSTVQDPQAVGNEVLAHADGLGASPAVIQLRYSQADVMSTPLNEVQVVHTTDAGQDVLLPDCAAGPALPAGISSCIVRPVIRTASNTFVKVLTTTTSRWHLRRSAPVENQGAPGAPTAITITKPKPGDGSVLKVSWTAPANGGAGPISAYRVSVDGKQRASTSSTSALVKNPGPGRHTVKVTAVNAAGVSPAAQATVKLAALSAPRKVTGVDGKAGAPVTVTVTWRGPSSAGGLTIKTYVVAVYKANGHKVSTTKVKASHHSVTLKLPPGSYRFKVRAVNLDGPGPWSGLSGTARAR